jgi:hypothetical protein
MFKTVTKINKYKADIIKIISSNNPNTYKHNKIKCKINNGEGMEINILKIGLISKINMLLTMLMNQCLKLILLHQKDLTNTKKL